MVEHDDDRAGMEADLTGAQRGLGLAVLRQHQLAAQQMLERLIIKAACRRAARLAAELGGLDPADARTPPEA